MTELTLCCGCIPAFRYWFDCLVLVHFFYCQKKRTKKKHNRAIAQKLTNFLRSTAQIANLLSSIPCSHYRSEHSIAERITRYFSRGSMNRVIIVVTLYHLIVTAFCPLDPAVPYIFTVHPNKVKVVIARSAITARTVLNVQREFKGIGGSGGNTSMEKMT